MNKETIERIRRFSIDRDWDQFHTPENLAKSIVIEARSFLSASSGAARTSTSSMSKRK